MPKLNKNVVIDKNGILVNKSTGEPVDINNKSLPKGFFMTSEGILVDFKGEPIN